MTIKLKYNFPHAIQKTYPAHFDHSDRNFMHNGKWTRIPLTRAWSLTHKRYIHRDSYDSSSNSDDTSPHRDFRADGNANPDAHPHRGKFESLGDSRLVELPLRTGS